MGNCYSPCAHCKRRMASTSITASGANLTIAATLDGALLPETKYCLIVAQPVPDAGKHLPVRVTITAENGELTLPMKKLYDKCGCGVCNLEYGCDLPKCRSRIPLYLTNGEDLIDLREQEHRMYCKGA